MSSRFAPAGPRQRAQRQAAISTVRDLMPATDLAVARLLRLADQGPPGARDWYVECRQALASVADAAGLPITSVVGAFAALSPSTDIDRNHKLLATLVDTGDCSHAYGIPIERARAILAGAAPLDVLSGPKVRAFYRNISEPHRPGPVTIDRHAFSALVGRPLSDREGKLLERPGAWPWAAGCYRSAGRRAGMLAHELQAAVWVSWREMMARGEVVPATL